MTPSAIVGMIVVLLLTWGAFGALIVVAARREQSKTSGAHQSVDKVGRE